MGELLKVVEEVHRNIMPHHVYLSFDMALSKKGWVVVEVNWGQPLVQIATGKGAKAEFMRLINGNK